MKTNLHSPFSILATVLAALVALSTLHFQPACAQTADDFNPGADFPVVSLAVQADGKILVGGWFTTLGGQSRSCIGRLNADGTVDTSFNPGAGALVFSLALQPDGQILVGGAFTTLGGQSRSCIGRLNADGTLDTSFNPGADSPVYSVALQADGKTLVGGAFTTLGGQSRSCIGRLNADGTVDTSFNPGANADVYSLALQADGKILVGGEFTTLGGQSRSRIGRLNADGTLDTTFNPGANTDVYSLALQADGKILVGGAFSTLGGQSRSCIGRLNADGTVDPTFNPAPGGEVDSLAVQADGKILVGGWFTALGGQSCSGLGRLNADGTLDTGFNAGAGGSSPYVDSLALQADGKILVGGDFTTLDGQTRNYLGRLNNTEPATQNLTFDGSAITWLRGGASPEVWRTTFDFSTNGTDWASLGAGARIAGLPAGQAGGWQLTSVSLPSANGAIRARGYVSGGQYQGSAWFVESDYGMPVFLSQPGSQTNDAGTTATFSVLAGGSAPLSFQWRKDGVPLADGGNIAGAATAMLVLTNVLGGDAGGYSVVVSNQFGSVTSAVAVLVVNLATLDSGFNPGANGQVGSLAVQPDGKILVGVSWFTAGGGSCLERLNPDGTLDTGFNPGADVDVMSLAVQADGKILVGGERLNADGTLDTGFNPGPGGGGVGCLALQADGKIVVGGAFTTLGGQSRNYIGRLNADGTVDTTFNPGASSDVYSLALQADGKILVDGSFTTLGGQPRNGLGRLNADGTVDSAFNPGAVSGGVSLAVQADGKILVGLGRLNADGTLDNGFNPGANTDVRSLALQADGKILVGGQFTTLGGQTRNYIGRLNADGTLDSSFNPGAGSEVDCLAVQADGKILVGGYFTNLCGQPRNYLGRLNNTEPATQSLSFDGSTITWLRGGASPEVWRTTFDYSTNGTDWASLGAGARIAGGWQLTSVSLPSPNGTIRARGYVTGGDRNASSWFVETTAGPPAISLQPYGLALNAGTTASFSVDAGGSEPLSYQWRKDGRPLADGGNIGGAATAMLVLTNVLGADAGGYSVVVSNGFGSVTSAVATLVVIDPLIAVQPVSQLAQLGQTATLSVTAAGTAPFAFQWWRDGAALAGDTGASLTLTNLQATDAGDYSVVVSNQYGSVTSGAALLAVNGVTLDTGFNPGADLTVCALALQPDGKILVGGTFAMTGWQSPSCIGRLNADGTVDTSFNPGITGGESLTTVGCVCVALQADGKILVGGTFTTLGGQSRRYIGQLNADGTVDPSFNPGASSYGYVECLALQADGKILVGGDFTTLGGQPRNYLGRLNADGTVDSGFNPGAGYAPGYAPSVYSLAVQADGKILVGGYLTTLGGQTRNYLGRLNADGTVDNGFNPGADAWVWSLALQADGKILVGGEFTTLAGQPRNFLGRLNADGTLDTTFDPGAGPSDGGVYSLALQADGKILVGGWFTTLGGQTRNNVGRLNADGTVDTSFIPGASGDVLALAVQADGEILVGGSFIILCGQQRNYLGRLNNTEPATQSLSFDGSTITWLRGGASPEVWRTTFDFSTDGTNGASLGAGTRIAGLPAGQAGGWQLTSVSLPSTNGTIRARGYVTGGQYDGSTWFVESDLVVGAPLVILVNDPSFGLSSNRFGFEFSGSVGQVVIVETSTDLASWTPVATNTLAATPSYFSDPYSGNFPRRFYRLRTAAP